MRELIDVRLPLDPGAPWTARRAVEDLPARFHDRLDTVQLAVSELVTNALVHADPDTTDKIRLVARERHGRLRVEVIGPPDGHDAAVSGWRATAGAVWADHLSDSNERLFMVRSIADRSGVLWDHGMVAWFELDAVTA